MEKLSEISYPVARKSDTKDNFHGNEIKDPYRWMENPNDPELIEWVKAQNKLSEKYINNELRRRYKEQLTELFDYPRFGMPTKRDVRYFYSKNTGLQPQPVYYSREGLHGEEQILFDPNTLSEDGTVAVVAANYSKNGNYVAFSISEQGSDWLYVKIFDTKKGEFLEEKLENIRNGAGIQWKNDNSGFYYSARVGKDESILGNKLWWHTLNTPQTEDPLIYEYPYDEEMNVYADLSSDNEYIFLSLWKSTMPRNMLYFKKMDEDDFLPIVDYLEHAYEVVTVHDNKALVYSNENADNGKILEIDLKNTDKSNWIEIIEENEYPIESKWLNGTIVSNNHLILTYIENVKSVVKIFDFTGKYISSIDLPTFGTTFTKGEKDQEELFIHFSSFTYPTTVYVYDFKNQELFQFHDPGLDINQEKYEIVQNFFKSKDGTEIPIYIMHQKNLVKNGNNPTILNGYGGFSINRTPTLNQMALLWMEQGGVYAIANLRGGGEYGEKWHKAGMLENKQNVFDDFISAAEFLISENYTQQSKLGIYGGSNGGLLVAASMLQRPNLFGAVVCAVGVLDMLRYHKFTIGRYWVPEYGDPSDPDHFNFLIKYSPLHNIEPIEYPPTFIYTADTDDRVDPAHSKKFAATLQEIGKGGPLLLRVNIRAGHGMGKPITKQIDDMSYYLAFLHAALDL